MSLKYRLLGSNPKQAPTEAYIPQNTLTTLLRYCTDSP